MAKRLDRAQFEAQIKEEGLSVIDFYSDSCVPCKRLSPLLTQIGEAYPQAAIGKVNVAYEKELAASLGVTSTPTLLFYKNGEEVDRLNGAIRKNVLEETITKYL